MTDICAKCWKPIAKKGMTYVGGKCNCSSKKLFVFPVTGMGQP